MATSLMNLLGRPPAFDATGDASTLSVRWTSWLEEFEAYADSVGLFLADAATDATKQQRRALLLYTAGKEVRNIFTNLPDTGTATEYKKAVDALDKHFKIKPNKTFQRHKFRKITQSETETISQLVAKLRINSEGCEFADLDQEIIDQVIQGVKSDKLRRKLLERGSDLDLASLLEISTTFEAVNDQIKQMNLSENCSTSINKISDQNQNSPECYRCGSTTHFGSNPSCPARGRFCQKCGGANHYAVKCRTKKKEKLESQTYSHKDEKATKTKSQYRNERRSKKRHRPPYWKQSKVNQLGEQESSDSDKDYYTSEDDSEVYMTRNDNKKSKNNRITVSIGGIAVEVIIDSGSEKNIISEEMWQSLKEQGLKIKSVDKCTKELYPYTSDVPLTTICSFKTDIKAGEKQLETKFLVIKEKGEPLLSRKTSMKLGVLQIGLNIRNINTTESTLLNSEKVKTEFKSLFTGFGKLKGRQVKFTVNPNVTPKAQPLRRTPFGLRSKVEEKIKELIDKDIIEPVNKPTAWVSPTVIVPKENGDIRMCIDMRQVNEAILRQRYPIPTIDELIQDMSESRIFTKLDLKLGYHQIEIDPDSRDITTFVTHCGLFRYKRLVMGINTASEIYQYEIQTVLQGISGVANLSDDIIIHAPDQQTHDHRLRQTLERLQEAGLTLNGDKCIYSQTELEFLGHKLTANGIDPSKGKIDAILNAREPENVSEVRSFLGLVNYCARFIPNHATLTEPLRKLTRKHETFHFDKEQKEAFKALKAALSNSETLGYYDPKAPTQVITDAGPVGIGGILVQQQSDGPRVICYASRSLTAVERRYSQTEKEALAIVWAVERFHPYIFGIEFELLTDHKPLQVIYGPRSKPSARIERWVLRLQGYTFKIKFIPGRVNIADPLSRLLKSTLTNTEINSKLADQAENQVKFVTTSAIYAITLEELDLESANDTELQTIREAISSDNWEKCEKRYIAISPELCTNGNIILRGSRLVIPSKLRPRVLSLAHEGHLGIVMTKQNLRTRVWWPGMEKDAEKFCKTCHGCQLVSKSNPPEPIENTELPERPWEHLAIDFLGPMPSGHSILVVIDYYSRYYEINIMKSTTAEKTVLALKTIFARHGNPITLTSDNGPQFISETFADYLKSIGVRHHKTTPKWPQANGEVERQNQSLLKRMKIAHSEGKDWKEELLIYLQAYRANRHPSTGYSPAELLFQRKLRTKMPQLNPKINDHDQEVRDRDNEQKGLSKFYADRRRNAQTTDIVPGDKVLIKRDKHTGKLDTHFHSQPFDVIEKTGSKVTVQSPEGVKYARNSSHLKKFLSRQSPDIEDSNQTMTPEILQKGSGISIDKEKTSGQQDGEIVSTPKRPERTKSLPKKFEDFIMRIRPKAKMKNYDSKNQLE